MANSIWDSLLGGIGDLWDSAFTKQTAGKNGAILTNQGWVDPVLSGIQAWNQKEANDDLKEYRDNLLDFSQSKFWTNFAMKRDDYNRRLNQRAAVNRQSEMMNNGTFNYANSDANYRAHERGDAIVNPDGSTYNVVGLNDKYANTQYNQPVGPTVSNAAPVGGPTVTNAARSRFVRPSVPTPNTTKAKTVEQNKITQ